MQIRFEAVTAEGAREIHADSIRITLPGGATFQVEAEPGHRGSAVFTLPASRKQDGDFQTFTIEPGAANLFSVNVVAMERRK